MVFLQLVLPVHVILRRPLDPSFSAQDFFFFEMTQDNFGHERQCGAILGTRGF